MTTQLRSRAGGGVVVTHDRALLSDIAEIIVDLDPTADDRVRMYGNGYAGYREGRQAEHERWEQEYGRQQVEHTRLQGSLSSAQNRLISGWRPEKGSSKHGRATRAGGLVQSVHRRQEQLEAHAVTVPEPPLQFQFPDLPTRAGAVLLSAERVSAADRLAGPVSFSLSHRGRLAVTGPNGAGKSTLLRVIAGELQPDTGSVRMPQSVRLGFLRQETNLPLQRRASEVYASRVDVLLLDEPTNHLSIALVDELTDALGATQAAVVLSTHDRQLLRDVDGWPPLRLGTMTESEALA